MDIVLCGMHFTFKISMLGSRCTLTYFNSGEASKNMNVKLPDNHSGSNDNMRIYRSSYPVETNSCVILFFFFLFGFFFGEVVFNFCFFPMLF